jgi:hypothetical protein
MGWKGHLECMGGKEECVEVFGGKARRKQTIRATKT